MRGSCRSTRVAHRGREVLVDSRRDVVLPTHLPTHDTLRTAWCNIWKQCVPRDDNAAHNILTPGACTKILSVATLVHTTFGVPEDDRGYERCCSWQERTRDNRSDRTNAGDGKRGYDRSDRMNPLNLHLRRRSSNILTKSNGDECTFKKGVTKNQHTDVTATPTPTPPIMTLCDSFAFFLSFCITRPARSLSLSPSLPSSLLLKYNYSPYTAKLTLPPSLPPSLTQGRGSPCRRCPPPAAVPSTPALAGLEQALPPALSPALPPRWENRRGEEGRGGGRRRRRARGWGWL